MPGSRKAALALLAVTLAAGICAWVGLWLGYATMPRRGSLLEVFVSDVAVGAGVLSALAGLVAVAVGIVSVVRSGRRGVGDLALGAAALLVGLTSGAAGAWMHLMHMVGSAR